MKMKTMWVFLAGLMFFVSAGVRAETQWQKDHPRRTQVNRRLKNQKNRVKTGEANGALTKAEGNKINRQDRRIRQEERRMAARDGGHITKADQAKLNRQENRVSNEINRDETANKAAQGAAAPAPAASGQ